MNIAELVKGLAAQTRFSQKACRETVVGTVDLIVDALGRGEEVYIPNLGKFEIMVRGSRVGRNPQTGATVQIGETKSVKFRPSAEMKSAVSGKPKPQDRKAA